MVGKVEVETARVKVDIRVEEDVEIEVGDVVGKEGLTDQMG